MELRYMGWDGRTTAHCCTLLHATIPMSLCVFRLANAAVALFDFCNTLGLLRTASILLPSVSKTHSVPATGGVGLDRHKPTTNQQKHRERNDETHRNAREPQCKNEAMSRWTGGGWCTGGLSESASNQAAYTCLCNCAFFIFPHDIRYNRAAETSAHIC